MDGARPAPVWAPAQHCTRARPQTITTAGVKMTTAPATGEVCCAAQELVTGEHDELVNKTDLTRRPWPAIVTERDWRSVRRRTDYFSRAGEQSAALASMHIVRFGASWLSVFSCDLHLRWPLALEARRLCSAGCRAAIIGVAPPELQGLLRCIQRRG